MFYFLSKTIDFVLMPFNISLALLIWAVFTKRKQRKGILLGASLVIMLLISSSFVVNRAFNLWEYKVVDIKSLKQSSEVGVVLTGGMINWATVKSDHIGMGRHADRFVQAFLLYKNKKIGKILITGFSPVWLTKRGTGEAREAKKLLVSWGVPEQDIILEELARNTRENAVNTAGILKRDFPNQNYILITSSFHMKRAMACFEKTGLKMQPFPADFYGGELSKNLKNIVEPDPDAFSNFHLLWREWIGYVVYSLMGYC